MGTKYSLKLTIAHPSINAPEKLSEREDDFMKAVEIFNSRFKGKKTIENVKVENSITLDLIMEIGGSPKRHLSALSQILKERFNWGIFSTKENRMFDFEFIRAPRITAREPNKLINETKHSDSRLDHIYETEGVPIRAPRVSPRIVKDVIRGNFREDSSGFKEKFEEIIKTIGDMNDIEQLKEIIDTLKKIITIAEGRIYQIEFLMTSQDEK